MFGTTRTITSGAYPEEIRKRCPKVVVVQQTCAGLAGAIERATPEPELDILVEQGVTALLAQTAGQRVDGRALTGNHTERRRVDGGQPHVVAEHAL